MSNYGDNSNYDQNDSDSERGNGAKSFEDQLFKAQAREDLCAKLIPMYNNLMDVFSAVDDPAEELSLPEIVVVGSQSAGKSSVLESLVSRQFLPRGDGLVTRCPIELRLNQLKPEETKEWVEFGHDTDIPKKRYPLSKVAKEILEQTNKLAGTNKGIVSVPIKVSVYSASVVPLTVVDLPGIVKNSTGDQPENIEEQINDLIFQYISKPSTIILAISAANNDIATSESLKLAKRVDPSGERTLGVITKLDKAERDSKELQNLLSGQIISLKYGFIGVRNPSPDDLKKQKTMADVRLEEERLLKEIVPHLAAQNGTKYLESKLNQLLVRHICKRLPAIENKIAEQLKSYDDKLLTLGSDDIPNKSKTMSSTLFRFVTKFTGEFEGRSRNINTDYVSGGARVKSIFVNELELTLAAVDPLEDVTDDQIAKAILSSAAMESSLSVPEAAYQHIVKTQIKKLLPPCLDCVRCVHEELQNTVEDCLDRDITFRFPRLTEHLVGAVHKFLSDRLTEVIKILMYHIEIESAFVSTSRRDFIEKLMKLMSEKDITQKGIAQSVLKKSVIPNVDSEDELLSDSNANEASDFDIVTGNGIVNGTKKTLNSTERVKQTVLVRTDDRTIVRSLVEAYFEIVRQSIRDFVPKLLTHSMIYYACDNLQVFLNEQLHTSEKIDDLVRVSEEASKQRVHARNRLDQLTKAQGIIKDFRQSIDF